MLGASGIGTYLRNILPQIAGLAPDWKFTLLGSLAGLSDLGLPRRNSISCVPMSSDVYTLWEQIEVPLRTPRGADLLWIPHYNVPLLYTGPIVVTIHDVLHLARPEFIGGPHRRWYARALFAAVAQRAVRIMVDSDFTGSELARHTGVSPERVRRVYPGVDESWFGLPPSMPGMSDPYVVFVGNVKPHKNLGTLLRAFLDLQNEILERLVIVGRRSGFRTGDSAVPILADQLGDRVQFTDEVSDQQVRQLVAGARALILPSFYEGFGLPPLEAMACGCPVLVSRCGSLPEVCGDAALYCDASDYRDVGRQLVRLLTDEPLRGYLQTRGRVRARQFTWQACAEETLAVLREAMSA